MRKTKSYARTAAARESSRAGPTSPPSLRRRAPDNRLCLLCTNPGQLTPSTNRRRLVAFQQDSHRRAQAARRSFHPFHQPRGALPMYTRVVEITSKSGKSQELADTIKDSALPILKKQRGFVDEIVLVSSGD